MSASQRLRTVISPLVTISTAIIVVLLLLALILLVMGKNPIVTGQAFLESALATPTSRAEIVTTALPMLLCASGLLLTFTAGLWNIGVEGQMILGAICATAIARTIKETDTSPFIVPMELLLGMVGGAAWAALAGVLKTRGRVNEIFGGVALNFIAQNILIYLLSSPWQGGRGYAIQTDRFADPALLPGLAGAPDLHISPLAILVTAVCFIAVFLTLRGTRWGLQLKAMGLNSRSAFLLGVPAERNVLLSMMACGALAGLAGAFQALFIRDQLITNISGGIGYLGLLIVLLSNIQALWVLPVAIFFAIVPIGTIKLQSGALGLDASIGNVFQSALVLAVLLANGVRWRLSQRRQINSS